jgi:hypothetical protein
VKSPFAVGFLLTTALVVGCVRAPFSTKHFEYSLDMTVAGRRYLIQRDVECYDVVGWNFGTGNWGRETHSAGGESSLVDVGDDLAVLVHPKTDCFHEGAKAQLQEHSKDVKLLKHPADAEIMYLVHGNSAEPSITVKREWSERTEHGGGFAASPAELEAANHLGATPAFIRVTVRGFSYKEWAAAPGLVEYVAQFNTPTPAPNHAVPSSGSFVENLVTFPNWNPHEDGTGMALDYDGTNFVWPAEQALTAERWWRLRPERVGQPSIEYKHVVFNIGGKRELYDPEERTIYDFVLWQETARQ